MICAVMMSRVYTVKRVMGQLYVVRHGQASFGSHDYDQLSAMGQQQSRWLGEYFAQSGLNFDRVFLGTLKRHQQTLDGICSGAGTELGGQWGKLAQWYPGLNEYDSEVMLRARLGNINPQDAARDRRFYFRELREALYDWVDGRLNTPDYQTFIQFRQGVESALAEACAIGANRVLLVSSGGPISNLVGHVLQTPNRVTVDINLQTSNTSITQFAFNEQRVSLMSFNTVPHLTGAERLSALTYA
jgi:broad specificity phosphatase PhoE